MFNGKENNWFVYAFWILLMWVAVLPLVGCYKSSHRLPQETAISTELFGPERFDRGTSETFPEYRIMPGDILDLLFQVNVDSEREFRLMPLDKIEIKFLDLTELNQEQRILPDGKISLPYLGAMKVVGYTPNDLRIELRKRYSRILKNPNIFVVVKEYGAKIQELKESIRTSARGQSKLITVRSDGYATFPIIGEVEVFNKTIPEVTQVLNKKFNTVTEDIKIDLLLHESQGARICVVGAVNRPGCYPIRRPLTLIEAVALAGGLSVDADSGTVVAMRKDGDKVVHQAVSLSDVLSGNLEARHWYISTNDIVYVSRSKLSEAARTARNIADVIFFRGWSIGFDRSLQR